MKKAILLCGMLLAVTASLASAAAGTNLRWASCFGDGGAINKAFACNSNLGSNVLVSSYVVGSDMIATSGQETVYDIAAAGATLPAWWQFKNVGTCRSTALTMDFVGTGTNCPDWATGQSAGGIGAYQIGARGPNTARIVAAIAVPASALADQFAGQEYFSNNIRISNVKTVGTGLCAGCTTPVCIVFNSINVVTQIAANDRKYSGATNGTDSNFVTWQGGAGVTSNLGSGCPAATPTRSSTWSSVKSLYR